VGKVFLLFLIWTKIAVQSGEGPSAALAGAGSKRQRTGADDIHDEGDSEAWEARSCVLSSIQIRLYTSRMGDQGENTLYRLLNVFALLLFSGFFIVMYVYHIRIHSLRVL